MQGSRILIDENFHLLIIKCPDTTHARGTVKMSAQISGWIEHPAVEPFLSIGANGGNTNDLADMQPDCFIGKHFGNNRATAVFDLEVGNRGIIAIREYGMRLFSAPGSEVQ